MNLQEFIKKHGNVNVDETELKEFLGIKDRKYFIPEHAVKYWYVGTDGGPGTYINDSDFDKEIIENNELFRTREEAEEHARKQRFLLQMKRDFLDNSEEIDWDDEFQDKCMLGYGHTDDELFIKQTWTMQYSLFVTTNKEWLENYANLHEEEIKKYYFEVK